MANVVSLHSRQVFAAAGEPVAYGKAYFYASGTATQVNVYADVDLVTQRSQPVLLDSAGVLPPCYVDGTAPLRVLITDENNVRLPGYPMDNIVPEIAEQQDASGIAFTPVEGIPATNVQDAMEIVAGLYTEQGSTLLRYFIPYTTGGTGNAYTLTPSPAVSGVLETGLSFMVMPDRANTGAVTLNVNDLGAVSLRKMGTSGTPVALAAGEIQPYREFRAVYNGSLWLMSLGRDFPYRGSGANGEWVRRADGTQECRLGPLEVPYAAGGWCQATWTFPSAFSAVTNLFLGASLMPSAYASAISTVMSGSALVSQAELGQITWGGVSTTGATVRVNRAQGADDFTSNDKVYLMIRAEGRWF
jgi:hypothetical protein